LGVVEGLVCGGRGPVRIKSCIVREIFGIAAAVVVAVVVGGGFERSVVLGRWGIPKVEGLGGSERHRGLTEVPFLLFLLLGSSGGGGN
jgi:hypothetical protein